VRSRSATPRRGLDLIDLAEAAIPPAHQEGPPDSGRYGSPEVQAFADRVGTADAFVVITPEYNHSYRASLKLAIDSVNPQWHAKPVGFVSYGGLSGGLRAVEHLRVVFAELHTVTIRETVSLHHVRDRFDEHGTLRDPGHLDHVAEIFLDQLAWWARTLRHATAIRPYPAGLHPAPAP
jgi:NAD(P)H-dependent FMN reductase